VCRSNGDPTRRRSDPGPSRPLLVGLTGGIAAGKSTVATLFANLGAARVDADEVAHEITAAGSETLGQLVQVFGAEILDPAGNLDRARLGAIVFADAEARHRLEALTHPAIAAVARARIEALHHAGHRVVVYEAALLVESGRQREMDLLVVVIADDEVRMRRLMERSQLSREAAERRLAAQLPQSAKAAAADFVIDNSGPRQQTRARVQEVWRRIIRRSGVGEASCASPSSCSGHTGGQA
jgi:dephospho-CoA kinase